jgi:subtilisin-like proprotein convertase family protein
MMRPMRRLLVAACLLAGCASGSDPGTGGDDVDAGEAPDASTNPPPDASDPPPDAPPGVEDCDNTTDDDGDTLADCADSDCAAAPNCTGGEVTAQEALCNDSFDNDGDGQMDCNDTTCAWACTALPACPSQLRAYSLAPMPQSIPDVSSVSASVAVAQTGTITLAAVRFNATHTWDSDIDLTLTSPAGTTLDLTSDNGSAMANFTNTVFIDSAPTSITAGTAPYTGSVPPEQPLSGLNAQSITGTWSSLLADDLSGDTGTWTELSIGLCVTP